MSRRVIIAGDRNWSDFELYEKITALLSAMPYRVVNDSANGIPRRIPDVEIVHGACKGVDTAAGQIAEAMGFSVKAFPADWSRGRWAGPARNKEMLDYGAVAVYLFHKNIGNSKGTKNMMDQAEKRGVPTILSN